MKTSKFKCMVGAVPITAIILSGQATFGQAVPVVNPSFESPSTGLYTAGAAGSSAITGWTIGGGGDAGVWNVAGSSSIIAGAADGLQIGYINPLGLTTVSQTLTSDLQSDSTYTLSIDVTGRADGENPGTGYSVGLYAGGDLLASVTPETHGYGTWSDLSATFTSGTVAPGEPLTIEISDWTAGGQLDFDNVTLTDPVGAGTLPDGGMTAMLLAGSLGALGWFRRKI